MNGVLAPKEQMKILQVRVKSKTWSYEREREREKKKHDRIWRYDLSSDVLKTCVTQIINKHKISIWVYDRSPGWLAATVGLH